MSRSELEFGLEFGLGLQCLTEWEFGSGMVFEWKIVLGCRLECWKVL